MSVEAFLDTNVLIYAAAGHRDEPKKNARAWALLEAANFGLSGQVLAEFYSNVTKKLAVPLSVADATVWIDRLCEAPIVAVDADLVREGVRHSQRYKINYWDGAILAAAERLGAPVLYTEDLSHDQVYGTVKAVNPFRQN